MTEEDVKETTVSIAFLESTSLILCPAKMAYVVGDIEPSYWAAPRR